MKALRTSASTPLRTRNRDITVTTLNPQLGYTPVDELRRTLRRDHPKLTVHDQQQRRRLVDTTVLNQNPITAIVEHADGR